MIAENLQSILAKGGFIFGEEPTQYCGRLGAIWSADF
jgi:hypothetical protein